MRYSIEPREGRYVKGCEFLSFARNLGTHATKIAKNLINMVKSLLILLKNLQQMHKKLLAKEQFKKHLKQLEI